VLDETAARLISVLRELERERWRIGGKIEAIKSALRLAGVPLPAHEAVFRNKTEFEYTTQQPFANMSLTDACERVVKDHTPEWLSKNQVTELVEMGGCKSDAQATKNSVEVTLRRLASRGRIEIAKGKGRYGNRYRWTPPMNPAFNKDQPGDEPVA
jgi:hypothetical protein